MPVLRLTFAMVIAFSAAAVAPGRTARGQAVPAIDGAGERLDAPLDVIEPFWSHGVAGTLTRPGREEGGSGPAVVLVHDASGADPRSGVYAAQLAAAGLQVLDLLSHPADGEAAARAAGALARDPRVDPGRIAVLGFGAGGAASAVANGPFAARVLLYPDCAALVSATAESAPAPVLLLHGDDDPANTRADCALAAAALRRSGSSVKHITYRDAGYAWDWPSYGGGRRALLPRPGALGLVPATSWPALADMAAAQVAGFLAAALQRPIR